MRPKICRVRAEESISALAARQYGVVATWQLASLGVSPSTIKTRIARNSLLRLHRGVYAVGHERLQREGRWLAAVLAVGPGAVLSHRDAAGLHGLRPANHLKVDVTTASRGRGSQDRIAVHNAALRAALAIQGDHGPTLTRSELEDRFVALLAFHRLPRPQMNAHIEGLEVDACWPEERLVVELDGYAYHRDRTSFQRDREKGNALTRAGWTLLRYTYDDVVRHSARTAAELAIQLA